MTDTTRALRDSLASAYHEAMAPVHNDLVPVPGDAAGTLDNSYRLPDKPIPYSCTDEEAVLLGYLIRKNGLKRGFEIATAFGFSSLAVGLALRDNGGKLVSMDCYVEEESESLYYDAAAVQEATLRVKSRVDGGGKLPQGLAFARSHAQAMGLSDMVSHVIGVSPGDVGAAVSPLGELDLAFIDGGHFGDQPLLDFLAVAPFLSKERCAVFFHDYSADPNDSIGRAVAEAEHQFGMSAIVLNTRWKLTLIGRGLDAESIDRVRQMPWRGGTEPVRSPTVIISADDEQTYPAPPTPEQISVVIQGAISGKPNGPAERQLTRRCLESLREHLPGAELILSTWEKSDVRGLDFDTLILNEDPGATCLHMPDPHIYVLNNVNRQIVSTRAGLMAATRPYALKIRTDFALRGREFLQYFGRYQKRADSWQIVRERVLACTVYSRNPHRQFPFAYHPSDFIYFGRREDVLAIWNIPLAPEPETSRYYEERPRPRPELFPGLILRYAPEQWIWTNFLRKHGNLEYDNIWQCSPEDIALSELTIANNLVLLEPWQWQLNSNKPRLTALDGNTIYTHGDWLRLYKRYCDPFKLLAPDWIRLARATRYRISESRAALQRKSAT